jgi:hypothetical protein
MTHIKSNKVLKLNGMTHTKISIYDTYKDFNFNMESTNLVGSGNNL